MKAILTYTVMHKYKRSPTAPGVITYHSKAVELVSNLINNTTIWNSEHCNESDTFTLEVEPGEDAISATEMMKDYEQLLKLGGMELKLLDTY